MPLAVARPALTRQLSRVRQPRRPRRIWAPGVGGCGLPEVDDQPLRRREDDVGDVLEPVVGPLDAQRQRVRPLVDAGADAGTAPGARVRLDAHVLDPDPDEAVLEGLGVDGEHVAERQVPAAREVDDDADDGRVVADPNLARREGRAGSGDGAGEHRRGGHERRQDESSHAGQESSFRPGLQVPAVDYGAWISTSRPSSARCRRPSASSWTSGSCPTRSRTTSTTTSTCRSSRAWPSWACWASSSPRSTAGPGWTSSARRSRARRSSAARRRSGP